jgi:hypothetical protein
MISSSKNRLMIISGVLDVGFCSLSPLLAVLMAIAFRKSLTSESMAEDLPCEETHDDSFVYF